MNPYRAALAAIHARGWNKGGVERKGSTEVCAVGALGCALKGDPWWGYNDRVMLGTEATTLRDLIAAEYPELVAHEIATGADPGTVLFYFNDHPDTTQEEVERMFEKAELQYDERI